MEKENEDRAFLNFLFVNVTTPKFHLSLQQNPENIKPFLPRLEEIKKSNSEICTNILDSINPPVVYFYIQISKSPSSANSPIDLELLEKFIYLFGVNPYQEVLQESMEMTDVFKMIVNSKNMHECDIHHPLIYASMHAMFKKEYELVEFILKEVQISATQFHILMNYLDGVAHSEDTQQTIKAMWQETKNGCCC